MVLVKYLFPLIAFGLILFFVITSIVKDNKEKEKKKLEEEDVDLDSYLKNLNNELKKAKERADRGIESALKDVEAYTAQITKINNIKTKKVEEL